MVQCCFLLLHINILNEFKSKSLSKIQHTSTFLACEVGFCQETIRFCDGEEESEDPIQPSLGCPHNLKADWGMSLPIVVIHSMSEHEVVVDDLWVLEGG